MCLAIFLLMKPREVNTNPLGLSLTKTGARDSGCVALSWFVFDKQSARITMLPLRSSNSSECGNHETECLCFW